MKQSLLSAGYRIAELQIMIEVFWRVRWVFIEVCFWGG